MWRLLVGGASLNDILPKISFLKLLHQACIRKHSLKPGFPSLCSFARLCVLRLLSLKAEKMGLCYLDWWPLAGEDELMIFQPHMEKQPWKIVRYELLVMADFSRTEPGLLVTTGSNP